MGGRSVVLSSRANQRNVNGHASGQGHSSDARPLPEALDYKVSRPDSRSTNRPGLEYLDIIL